MPYPFDDEYLAFELPWQVWAHGCPAAIAAPGDLELVAAEADAGTYDGVAYLLADKALCLGLIDDLLDAPLGLGVSDDNLELWHKDEPPNEQWLAGMAVCLYTLLRPHIHIN